MYLADHLEKLRYFYEVARLGSMKRASEAVYISQPSLTKSIQVLEDAVGEALFIRQARGVSLTKRGELLMQFCQDLFASIADVEKKLAYPDNPMAGSLRVGTYDSIGVYFWPKFLQSFLVEYPELDLKMSIGRSGLMQHKLESGELDLILTVEPKATRTINTEVIVRDTFKFYVSTEKSKTYDTIEKAPLILMPETVDNEVAKVLALPEINHHQQYTSSSLESVKELAINGIGIALLPELVAKDAVKDKKLKEIKLSKAIPNGIGEHSIGIAYQSLMKENPLIKTLVSQIKAYKW